MRILAAMCAAIMTISTVSADAQEAEKEPAAIVEIGSAGEWTINGNGAGHGPSFAVETTPIEHWLEIEGGVTPLFSRGRIEWDMDLLFKKPFTLSPTVEFMIGAGPSWSHTVAHGRSYNTLGAEVALDFMFWPWQGRKIGWYLEPSYGYSFSASHERTLGASAGILIPIH